MSGDQQASTAAPKRLPSLETTATTETTASTTTKQTSYCSAKWTQLVGATHKPILRVLHAVSQTSARHPRRTVVSVIAVSFAMMVVGLFSPNFHVNVDEEALWAPPNSKPQQHLRWIEQESGFSARTRPFQLLFHQDGENVLGQRQVRRVFEAFDTIRSLPGYVSVCGDDSRSDDDIQVGKCPLRGVVDFWNQTASIFEAQVTSDSDAIQAMSAMTYPSSAVVRESQIFGMPQREPDTQLLVSAQSYILRIELPDTSEGEALEKEALDAIFNLGDTWELEHDENSHDDYSESAFLRIDVFAYGSLGDEFERAVLKDIPLVPAVFIIMSLFTCLVFSQWRDHEGKLSSRTLLGLSAVVAVLLSLMSAYGLLFLAGVPLTSMTQILPFVIFGVGLDDCFVVSGSFHRISNHFPLLDPVDRIHAVMEDVGMSITVTTLTSTIAFALGCISSIPAIYWLCLYAFPTIFIVYLYQLTFFVACIVLDEQRIQQGRRDCCTCFTVKRQEGEEEGEVQAAGISSTSSSSDHAPMVERWMRWYGKQLLRPSIRALVFIAFAAMSAGLAYSTSNLRQYFAVTDVLPDDSYATSFLEALDDYTNQSPNSPYVYFRFVNQSDPTIHKQMEQYIEDLVSIDAIVEGPRFFWLRDFQSFILFQSFFEDEPDLKYQPFNQQLDLFLSEPVYELYRRDLVLDSDGYIVTSRVQLEMNNIERGNVNEEIGALEDQRAVTAAQPVNAGRSDWAFFSYDANYNAWEFYSVSVEELILTTIVGVAAVTGVALLFIPHWSAALFVLPLISMLYVNLLGFIQWLGVSVNPVSYLSLVMSIGLLVDFIVHILVRYYETPGSRGERIISMLSTMGASILLGGVSTLLGILPLAFSSSDIFRTVFISFFGLVVLGASHGLVLLPVILSVLGPEDTVHSTCENYNEGGEDPSRSSHPSEDSPSRLSKDS